MNQVPAFMFVKNKELSQIQFLKTHWRENLLAPQDDMWEAFMELAVQWEIIPQSFYCYWIGFKFLLPLLRSP